MKKANPYSEESLLKSGLKDLQEYRKDVISGRCKGNVENIVKNINAYKAKMKKLGIK